MKNRRWSLTLSLDESPLYHQQGKSLSAQNIIKKVAYVVAFRERWYTKIWVSFCKEKVRNLKNIYQKEVDFVGLHIHRNITCLGDKDSIMVHSNKETELIARKKKTQTQGSSSSSSLPLFFWVVKVATDYLNTQHFGWWHWRGKVLKTMSKP